MKTTFLGLGSNLGDRLSHLQAVLDGVQRREEVRVMAASPVYETEAHTKTADENQPSYLNAVVQAEIATSPEQLLRIAHVLEQEEGRSIENRGQWAPRPLDVDLLVVGDVVSETDRLTLPHPRLAERRFVLQPWADLAPGFEVPPPHEKTVQALLDACTDSTSIRQIEERLRL